MSGIPYGDYDAVMRHDITSAERHRRDYASAGSALVEKAAIPVERIGGPILLISGARDAIWPSDPMSAQIVDRLAEHGKIAEWLSFVDAGHFVCGTGDSPVRYYDGDEIMSAGGSVAGNGHDAGQAWEATLAFLGKTLRR